MKSQIVSGQTTTETVGGIGRPVQGKFIYAEGMNPDDFFINARANVIGKSGRAMRDSSAPDSYMPDSYLLEVAADHSLRIDNVAPGDYQIHIFLQEISGGRMELPDEPKFTMPPIPVVLAMNHL